MRHNRRGRHLNVICPYRISCWSIFVDVTRCVTMQQVRAFALANWREIGYRSRCERAAKQSRRLSFALAVPRAARAWGVSDPIRTRENTPCPRSALCRCMARQPAASPRPCLAPRARSGSGTVDPPARRPARYLPPIVTDRLSGGARCATRAERRARTLSGGRHDRAGARCCKCCNTKKAR